MRQPNYDMDLRYGKEGEVYVNHLLTSPIEDVEVKRDRKWIETGNVFIEQECWSDIVGSWYRSGINATTATHWSFVLEDMVLTVPTQTVQKAIAMFGIRREMNRPEYSTKGMTVTVNDLLKTGKSIDITNFLKSVRTNL